MNWREDRITRLKRIAAALYLVLPNRRKHVVQVRRAFSMSASKSALSDGEVLPPRGLVQRETIMGDDEGAMGDDEGALLRLWREKRGEVAPEDLSGNLIVQLGLATEELNGRSYEGLYRSDHPGCHPGRPG